MAARIRKGDTVVVISGKDKGKTGKVMRVLREDDRVVIEGINLVKRHTRPSPPACPAATRRRISATVNVGEGFVDVLTDEIN